MTISTTTSTSTKIGWTALLVLGLAFTLLSPLLSALIKDTINILLPINSSTRQYLSTINYEQQIANFGTFIFTLVALQWLIDSTARQNLINQVIGETKSSIAVRAAGISNVTEDSKSIDIKEEITQSNTLIIGTLYSSDWFSRNSDELKRRIKSGKKTTILMLSKNSEAANYIRTLNTTVATRLPTEQELITTRLELDDPKTKKSTRLLEHNSVLRYSFIATDRHIWIKPYRNSTGFSKIPALQIDAGSPLYSFFHTDIEQLIKDAQPRSTP